MNINRDNYEEFFLDFAEGRLTAEQEEILNNFLKANPDLEAELNEFDLLQLKAEAVLMPGKQRLKKEIPVPGDIVNELNFEMFAIAYLENDLSDRQRVLFEDFISGDEKFQESFALTKKAYLKPEYLAYPLKNKLKKKGSRSFAYRLLIPVAAAAAIALLLLVKTDPVTMNYEIAALPEAVIEGERVPEKPEKVGTEIKKKAATIQIIKSSRAAVPVNKTIQTRPAEGKEMEKSARKDEKRTQRIALNTDHGPKVPAMDVKEDKLSAVVLPLPTINSSSLAISDRVRFELDRASGIMNEDDVFFWNLAEQGIKEINRLVGTEMSLMASQDEDGDISGFRFNSRILNVTAPLYPETE